MKQLEFFVELNGKFVRSYKNSLQKAMECAFKYLANSDNSVCVWDNYGNMYYPENYRYCRLCLHEVEERL